MLQNVSFFLAGKELGTDVDQWFGPSVAAGAIKYVYSFFFLFFFLCLTFVSEEDAC